MVNTFLVCADYRESAQLLDSVRLNKQGTEALELIYAILNIRIVAHYFGWQLPEDSKLWSKWIPQLVSAYVALPYRLVVDDNGAIIGTIPVNPGTTAKYILKQAGGGRVVRLSPRPANHPVIRAWLLWLDSLKEYYNAHIQVWIERGGQNTRPLFPVQGSPERPPWTLDSAWHLMFRRRLLHKELFPKTRKDGRPGKDVFWYRRFEIFVSAGPSMEQWWPY